MRREVLEQRQAEMKARLHNERLAPARRVRAILNAEAGATVRKPKDALELAAWKETQARRKHEGFAFIAMGCKLRAWDRMEKQERYVTAFYGVKTSWPRVMAHAKYAVCSGV